MNTEEINSVFLMNTARINKKIGAIIMGIFTGFKWKLMAVCCNSSDGRGGSQNESICPKIRTEIHMEPCMQSRSVCEKNARRDESER